MPGPGGTGWGDGAGTPEQQRGLRESRRLHQAGQGLVENGSLSARPNSAGDASASTELSRLRAQVATLEGEREMRQKLEKLLEVQTVQVDLQKELRVKTESLLQVEQQTSSKLRQQMDELRRFPGGGIGGHGALRGLDGHAALLEQHANATQRIRTLERQLQAAEAGTPATRDPVESELRGQLEEQERVIQSLRQQMAERDAAGAALHPEGEVLRLQLLLQGRDKHLDELTSALRQAQGEATEAQSEVDTLKQQVRILQREVSDKSDLTERQLRAERDLRAEIFQTQARLEQVAEQHQDEARRATGFAEKASTAEERLRRIEQLEAHLAEEQAGAKREREQLAAESEHRMAQKEQTIKHQTTTIESLTRELKEKQAEIDRLLKLDHDSPTNRGDAAAASGGGSGGAAASARERERGGLLPPLQPQSPRSEDIQGQRSFESLHRQLKAKDTKISKQTERLQVLTDMLEKRDRQLEELSTAKRDRERMQQKVAELEDVMKSQTRVVSHAEAERRLIEQERRLRESDRQAREALDALRREQAEKEAHAAELRTLRASLADGASSSGVLQAQNSKLAADLVQAQRQLDARTIELQRLRDAPPPPPPTREVVALPAVQRKLQRLEETDRALARDVALLLQEREGKLEGLQSTIAMLRATVDDLRRGAAAAEAGARVPPGRDAGTSPLPVDTRDASMSAHVSARDANVGIAPEGRDAAVGVALLGQDAGTSTTPTRAFDAGTSTRPQGMQDSGTGTSPHGAQSRGVATSPEPGRSARDGATGTSPRHAQDRGTATTPPALRSVQERGSSPVASLPSGRRTMLDRGSSPPPFGGDARARASSPAVVFGGVYSRDAATSPTWTGAFHRDATTSPLATHGRDMGTGTSATSSRDAATVTSAKRSRDAATATVARSPSSSPSRGVPMESAPYGRDAARNRTSAPMLPATPARAQQVSLGFDPHMSLDDLRTLSLEDLRQELIARRMDSMRLEEQLEEKKQLTMKLIEEANLCNAEVASLQQTVQQAYKNARKQDREYDKLLAEKSEFEKMANTLRQALDEKQTRISKLFAEHQRDTSGNHAVDEVDQKVGWKLKVLNPRQHEIRHSVFLVLNRRRSDPLDKTILAAGLASHLAIAASRIEIVEDARLPDSADGVAGRDPGDSLEMEELRSPRSSLSRERSRDSPDPNDMQADETCVSKRDLVLVNIDDSEPVGDTGQFVRSAVAAVDVLDQIRNESLAGHRIGPIDGVNVDAVFINHGDMVLPFEWPGARAQLLLREGRILAGKHAVITVHEVKDPYILRIVAFDTEVGREFVLYLNKRDVMLLLDTRDSEVAAQASPDTWAAASLTTAREVEDDAPPVQVYRHLEGPSTARFRTTHTLGEDAPLLDVVVSSLSFSVWQGHQILVASEMRVPVSAHQQEEHHGTQTISRALDVEKGFTSAIVAVHGDERHSSQTPAMALPERGVTRGPRVKQVDCRRLFEDVVGFEGRFCVVSLLHTTTPDLQEDMLRAVVYYPKTCRQVETFLAQPMLADRFRVVAEAGELDQEDAFCVAVVVEEIMYPPSFCIRLTSVTLRDDAHISPGESAKPHSHVFRVTKDGSNALTVPDVSFAVSHSTIRTKLLRCIGLLTPVQGPRETTLKMPGASAVTGADVASLVPRVVTGSTSDRSGLAIQLVNHAGVRALAGGAGSCLDGFGEKASATVPAAMRAHLREKYGKGRLLVRLGRMLGLEGADENHCIRAVVSVYERNQPYQHFVTCAYEPQTSREWEVVADSIDIFKLFADKEENRSQALDLGNPATRERLAKVLAECAALANRQDELVLIVSTAAVRAHVERERKEQRQNRAIRDKGADGQGRAGAAATASLEVQPAATNVQTRAVGGFNGGYDRQEDVLVEQRARDRLFVAQRRLSGPKAIGKGDLFKICIYDAPMSATLHSYILVATPAGASPLVSAGLPAALLADPGAQLPEAPQHRTYTLRVDDRLLDDFLWDERLREPSRQEELLSYISWNLHLDEDRDGQLRLNLRKKKLRAHQIPDAMAQVHETGGKAPAAHLAMPDAPGGHGGTKGCREIGGGFPLMVLRSSATDTTRKDSTNSSVLATRSAGGVAKTGPGLQGPSIRGNDAPGSFHKGLHARGFRTIHCMAQRFGHSTCIITVSRLDLTYKLSVYEAEASALYEMYLVTQAAPTPLNVLVERCDLGGKLDLVLCLHESPFPHQLHVCVVHVHSGQEWNVKIGDDVVYQMLANSRREIFMLYFEQLVTWGCVGFHVPAGTEEQALAGVFEETFSGNQVFERAQVGDPLANDHVVSNETGELKPPAAIAPPAAKRVRVPVVRTQLDFLGKKTFPPAGIVMHLLYHAEQRLEAEGPTVLLRIHKRTSSNDIALTLRVRREGMERSLPQVPEHSRAVRTTGSSAQGRSFDTPALGAGEVGTLPADEVTIWLQDKRSRAPYGAYAEFCEVPGCRKQLLVLITDEDNPRCMRIAVALAHLPFTVLFQVVLLETSETSARVEASMMAKATSSRRVMLQTFQKFFAPRGVGSYAATHVHEQASAHRDRELRQKLDDVGRPLGEAEILRRRLDGVSQVDGSNEHLGIEHGPGTGAPVALGTSGVDETVETAALFMCTRRKVGRMMVFTIFRDLVGHNMYLRVVMHDSVTQKDCHLTLLHFTTQRLMSILRISRDMLEECREQEPDRVKAERHQLRAELGKMIVDHLFLQRVAPGEANHNEEIDGLELPEDEDLEYELRMHDIMDPSNAAMLTAKRKLLATAEEGGGLRALMGSEGSMSLDSGDFAAAAPPPKQGPRTLLDTKHEALVHKAEKDVSGRRVLVTFYNETVPEDILHYSHNIRVVVACVQTLQVLCMQDFHEDKLQIVCDARGKSHLMSVTREQELVREMWDSMVLQHVGQEITGISLGGLEGISV